MAAGRFDISLAHLPRRDVSTAGVEIESMILALAVNYFGSFPHLFGLRQRRELVLESDLLYMGSFPKDTALGRRGRRG